MADTTEFTPQSPPTIQTDGDASHFLKAGELSTTPPVPAESMPMTCGSCTRQFQKLFGRLLYVFPILAVVGGIACALTLLFDFDGGISHIRSGSVWFALVLTAWGLGLMLAILSICPFGRRVRQFRLPRADAGVTFCGLFTAAMCAILSLRQLYTAFTTAPDPSAIVDTLSLTRLGGILLLIGAVYFLWVGLGKRDTLGMVLSLVACLGVILVLFWNYFDFTLPLNSPLRHLDTIAWSALLLFLLSEARMQVDLWYTSVPFSLFSALTTVLFTGGYGLTGVILALTGDPQFDLIQSALFVGAGGLAFCRVSALPSLIGDHIPPPPTKDEIKKYAKKHKIPLPAAKSEPAATAETDPAPHTDNEQ